MKINSKIKTSVKISLFALFLLTISSYSANANAANDKCNLDKIKIGENYSSVVAKFKIKHDSAATNSSFFKVQTRGSNFCEKLDRSIEVTMVFTSDKLSKITFYNYNEANLIEDIVKNTFGESNLKTIANKYGNNDVVSWKADKTIIVYSKAILGTNSPIIKNKNQPVEILNFSSKEFSNEISAISQKNE